MNNLETAIPFMKQLAEMLEEKKNSINFDLEDLKIRGIDMDNSILRINEQIKTAETKYTIAFIGTFKTGKSTIVPPNKPCQKSRSIFSVGRIEKGTDLVRI